MRRRYRHSSKPLAALARATATGIACVVLVTAGAALAGAADARDDITTGSVTEPGTSTGEPEPPPTEPSPTPTEPQELPPPDPWRTRSSAPRPAPDPAPPQLRERAPRGYDAPLAARPDPRPTLLRQQRRNRDRDQARSLREMRNTIWLHRALPDPIRPAARLAPGFATELASAAQKNRVGWSLVLAVLRTRGRSGAVPAGPVELQLLAGRLSALGARSHPKRALRELSGSQSFAERVTLLAHYNRAVGLQSLVTGLEKAKPRLQRLILSDRRIDVYWGGEGDIRSGKIDVRVLVLIRYLANVHGQVTVSSLHSGHGLYSRPGVISAHIYGLAVDISALGGVSILGHQQPGSVTERAVRSILVLPGELQAKQVISLLGLGGPSFPLGNHDDHIHVGY